MKRRILANALILFSLLFCPFWLTAILIVAGVFIFPRFYEGIAALFLADLLYGIKEARFYGSTAVLFSLGGLFLIVLMYVKEKVYLRNAS